VSSDDPVARIRDAALEKAAPELIEHAEAIRRLGKRILSDVIEIGERLTRARRLVGPGHWLAWLKTEIGWSDETARRFMDVYETSRSHNLWDLQVPVSALYDLARAPKEIRDEVIAQCSDGEKRTLADVRRVIAASKAAREDKVSRSPPPPPSNAENVAMVERDVAQEIALGLKNLAFQFNRRPNADKLVEKLSADEREAAREGIEAAMQIKAALDKLSAGWTDQAVTIFPNWKPRR
jgi:hypothetical protein